NADVVMLGHILHDWNLDEKRMLIGKAHDALPTGGALIVYEAIIDDDRSQNAFGLLMSLNMLIETEGGFDYTGADRKGAEVRREPRPRELQRTVEMAVSEPLSPEATLRLTVPPEGIRAGDVILR